MHGSHGGEHRRVRADALRNRDQLLRAAASLVIEHGPTVNSELIAKKAKVGIATLYRHFPDRTTLLRHIGLDLVRRCATIAESALREESDAFAALARYMHQAIDLQIGAVMPILAEPLRLDEEVLAARHHTRLAVQALVDAAHREGSLRADITSGDIGLLIIRLTPPLPGAMAPEYNHELSHRHLELVLDGLLHSMRVEELPGPSLSVEELAGIESTHKQGYVSQIADLRTMRHG